MKNYDFLNESQIKKLAVHIKTTLTRKGYTISTPLLMDALNSSSVKNIKCLGESNEIDFTTVNLFKSLDSDSIVNYFLFPIYSSDIYDRVKKLLSVIISARVWLRDNNNEPLNLSVLRYSLILNVIEKEFLTHEKLPEYIIKNILSYLDDLKKHFSRDGNISKEELQEAHGYLQMMLTRPFYFMGDNFSQLEHNELSYNNIKLLAYDMGIYFNGQKNNIKHSDLIESIVIALGYKNHHVYSAKYKILNKSHLYKNKIKTVNCLFEKGISSQIMNAIIDYMPINKNNIHCVHIIRVITNILVYMREKEKTPITFDNIISLLELDVYQLSEVIEKYKCLTGVRQYEYNASSSLDVGGNYKILAAQDCIELYAGNLYGNDRKVYEAKFKEQHKHITSELKKALTLLENKGIK